MQKIQQKLTSEQRDRSFSDFFVKFPSQLYDVVIMRQAIKNTFRVIGAISAAALLCSCAATVQTVVKHTDTTTNCAQLEWDDCARATQCRQGRAWVETQTTLIETFVCEARPPAFPTAVAYTGETVADLR